MLVRDLGVPVALARRPFRVSVKASAVAVAAAGLVAPGVVVEQYDNTAATASTTAVPRPIADWQHDRLASGVDLYQGRISGRPGADHWTVTVRANGAHLATEQGAEGAGGATAWRRVQRS
jgi:hypothetical protein